MSRIYSIILTVLVLLGFCECMDMKLRKLPQPALEKCLNYTCSVRASEDTIYVSEGGKADLTLNIHGNNHDARNASYTLSKLEEKFNRSGIFSLAPHDPINYGSNYLTYTTQEIGKHNLCFEVGAHKDDDEETTLKTGWCTIHVEARRCIPYQATGELSTKAPNTIILTIREEGNQSQVDQNSVFNIENVEWTNGVKGEVNIVPLKVGSNNINFDIYDTSKLQFRQQPEIMLTLGGADRKSKKLTINMDCAISMQRMQDNLLQKKESRSIVREFDKAFSMPTEKEEDKDKKIKKLEEILIRTEFFLFLIGRDIEMISRHIGQAEQRRIALGLAIFNLEAVKELKKEKKDKEKIRDKVREKVKVAKSQVLVIEREEENATAALFNALQLGDEEAADVLVHDPSLNLGIVPAQGRSLLQEAMEHGDTDVIDILKKKGADPNLTEKFGAAKWNKYFGEVGPEPPIPTHIGALLNQPCKLFHGKKVHETHLLTLIPTTVKRDDIEEPLTLNSFQRLLGNSKETGYKGGYHYYDAGIAKVFGDKTYAISHWVLMTRDIIPGSDEKQYDYQKKFMEHTASRLSIPYTLVSVLEGVVSAMCHHIDTGRKLLPKTASRCREVLPKRLADGGIFTVVFRNFIGNGIEIDSFREYELKMAGVVAAVR